MQFKVQGTPAPNANLLANLQAALPTYFAANEPAPIVPWGTYGNINLVGGQMFANQPLVNKTIAEDFDPIYGRMNAMLGNEQASTNSAGQQTWGWHYADPSTDVINPFATFNPANPVDPAVPYGTQIWKITHNGVDTHAIHFHLFNVQVVNRVDWVGVIKPPDPNEMGWKDVVRMNPLEDVIVALKPKIPTLPATMGPLPNSYRPLDPTMPVGMTNAQFWTSLPAGALMPNYPFTDPWPPANNAHTVNNWTDFGWEYIWHCHLLGHEENDMMRTISVQVSPAQPTAFKVSAKTNANVTLQWANHEPYQTNFTFLVQRATNKAFTAGLSTFTVSSGATNLPTYTATDTPPAKGVYWYRVLAQNISGKSGWSNGYSVKF